MYKDIYIQTHQIHTACTQCIYKHVQIHTARHIQIHTARHIQIYTARHIQSHIDTHRLKDITFFPIVVYP